MRHKAHARTPAPGIALAAPRVSPFAPPEPPEPRSAHPRVLRAQAMGFCFGVRDALAIARAVPRPQDVTIHGQLVHNESITAELHRRGFASVDEADRDASPTSDAVLITAHGISNAQRRRLEAAGKTLIDTTCPLVRRAHDAATRLASGGPRNSGGRHVLVIGRRGHVEVLGLTGDLPSFDVVESPRDVRNYPHQRLGVVCQTTSADRDVELILAAIRAANPQADIAFVDTVCQPTRDRQEAIERLLDEVTVLVVVGGKASNNTRRLADRAAERGRPAHHIQGPADLDAAWFHPADVVGLTAGTSTPDDVIDAVELALNRLLESR
ncbi:MAG: 4-hydroxy-3-methylbut-2-enyl diphosphate reductase [Planctomycetota bacterium]|nr:4-hydroxy-3-methylbut-2-enyl diphosphate reductase [Planctomycetota bacterium]